MSHVLELRCEPIPFVRIGLVGLGNRGLKTLARYGFLKHAAVVAVADLDDERTQSAYRMMSESGRDAARTYSGENCWKKICRDGEIDLIYICTDWESHARIAVEAMLCGKHVAVEVPAAMSVDDCWQLVDTAEKTRRHCFMTENCCYDSFSLSVMAMADEGFFGEINHCEGAYIHHLEKESPWMGKIYARHGGNPYPTHGLGPAAWLMRLHRGDRLDHLVSMTADEGRQNTTLLKTLRGKTLMLQLDVTTPRPYSRLQVVCGTQGFARKYPQPAICHTSGLQLSADEALYYASRHFTGHAARAWQHGKSLGVENEMNYAMDSRLIHCLRSGLPLDIDVYDAAEWSCIAELSRSSAKGGSIPVEVPDFTRGNWDVLKKHTLYQ